MQEMIWFFVLTFLATLGGGYIAHLMDLRYRRRTGRPAISFWTGVEGIE